MGESRDQRKRGFVVATVRQMMRRSGGKSRAMPTINATVSVSIGFGSRIRIELKRVKYEERSTSRRRFVIVEKMKRKAARFNRKGIERQGECLLEMRMWLEGDLWLPGALAHYHHD